MQCSLGLFAYALDGIVAFSTALLVLAFVLVVFIVVRTLLFGDPVNAIMRSLS